MSEFFTAAKVSEIRPGNGKTVEIKGIPIAIFNVNGQFHAIHDTCLHAGGPIGEGYLEDHIVTCPWHGWKYDVITGQSPVVPTAKVQKYEVKVVGDEIQVAV